MKFEIKHRFSGAVMFECELAASFETKSYSIQLGAAVKKAVKARANLARANLAGADLAGANLAAQLGQPNNWWAWTYVTKDGKQRVRVGCRDFTIAEGRAYWANKPNRLEVLAALDYAEAIGKLRGWNK